MAGGRRSGFLVISIVSLLHYVTAKPSTGTDIELDEKYLITHRLDSLNILLYTVLLILTVVTIWMFKYHRARYLHETGLAVIYGLIVGAILRYSKDNTSVTHIKVVAEKGQSYIESVPPDSLWFRYSHEINNATSGRTYVYSFKGEIAETLENEIVQKATFDPEIFFNILLPPIIFSAGYSLKRKHFFKNLGAIFTFAFIGTTISTFVVGGLVYGFLWLFGSTITFIDCLLFGALISATDPVTVLAIFSDLHVDVNLYALVFGESVLNDAVAIVLSSAIESYGSDTGDFETSAFFLAIFNFLWIFSMSFLIGSLMGCLTAILTKFTRLKDFPLLETALFVLMSYSTFLMAEGANLTGIVAVLFCGICQAHYTYNNLSVESRVATKTLFELLNFLSENFIFSYIGVSMFTFDHHKWDPGFICIAFVAIIVGRFLNIYPLSCLLNIGRYPKIPIKFMNMLFFSGLRGAIAFALAIRNTSSDARKSILTTTSLIVIVTVILCGGFTTQVLSWLGIPVDVEDDETHHLNQFQPIRNGPGAEEGGESAVDSISSHKIEKAWLFRIWSRFDVKFMKPLLTNSRPTLLDTTPLCCAPLARILTTTEQLTQGMLWWKGCQSVSNDEHNSAAHQDRDPLNDDLPLDDTLLGSGGVRTSIDSTGKSVTNPVYDGDLGLGTTGSVPTRVSVAGSRGQDL
ncbi:sodium/hydrogen exchanger 9-like isoform X2 [Homarus americanus]|uniref:sodium/hydrogen exchanger 9-like isoform X2 n=1 Tax=Homarus americanus TaxID=6706 RepID=UPI001C45D56F|nr:sodium/hydrogen exchanger 9-like isoform X2 [Homarus americanus]